MTIAILNTSIITAIGEYSYTELSLEEAIKLVKGEEILSAVGHQSTAEILSELLETPIAVNRINFSQQPGQKAIVFKLRGRPPEGTILTRSEIEAIGYDFNLLTRKA